MKKKGIRGFTLTEVLMTMGIFAIVAVGLMGLYAGIARMNEYSRNVAQAMADIRVVLEAVRDSAAVGLGTVTATNWTTWARANGLSALPGELMTVTYVNPAADPLQVTVQANWTEWRRARSASVVTLVTQR